MKRLALLAALAALVASCDKAQEPSAPAQGQPSKAARQAPPPIQVAAWFNSPPLTLEGLKGKVVVLDFWNTTCAPCRKLMPHLAELHAKHASDGLVIIGVTEDEKADLEDFLKKNPVPYPLAIDQLKGGSGQTFDAYKIGSIPTACLIARDGSLVWKGPGDKLTDAMVLAELGKK